MLWCILIIAILIFIFYKAYNSDSGSESSPANSSSSISNSNHTSKGNTNRVQFLTNNSAEQSFASAKIENGVVYCCGYTKDFKIGSYETGSDGNVTVWNDDHTERIGMIYSGSNKIHLTVNDLFVSIKKFRPYCPTPSRFIWNAANIYPNIIADADSNQLIANYQGDPIAAAAGFVCLTYEVLTENKYYAFFHGWYH